MQDPLHQQLYEILKVHDQGISEFELLRELQVSGYSDFGPDVFSENLLMYRAHFLLFHALYQLRDDLYDRHSALMVVHVLKIKLLDWKPAVSTEMAIPDPMREYYLDIANLEDTTLEDVDVLLGKFWGAYFAKEKRVDALDILELKDPVSDGEIEIRYRKMAMILHPDRGGEKKSFQELQQAIVILRGCAA